MIVNDNKRDENREKGEVTQPETKYVFNKTRNTRK